MAEEGIEPHFAAFGLEGCDQWLGMVELGKAITLVGIEDRIGLQHAPALRILTAFSGFDLLGVALVEYRDGRLLAFADLTTELLTLAVCHPVGRGVSAGIGHHPEPEGIHAAIRCPAGAQRARKRQATPRLDPGFGALLQLFNDGSSDAPGWRN